MGHGSLAVTHDPLTHFHLWAVCYIVGMFILSTSWWNRIFASFTIHCSVLSVMAVQPYPEWSDSGLHFNHSLWSANTDESVMYDSSQADNLSEMTRWWLAGLLKHASALLALCCPTVNCYRRLGGCLSPTFADWAIDDRDAAMRVKNYAPKVNTRLY